MFAVACAWLCSAVPAPLPAPTLDQDQAATELQNLLDDTDSELGSVVSEVLPELQDVYFPQFPGVISVVIEEISDFFFRLAFFLVGTTCISLYELFFPELSWAAWRTIRRLSWADCSLLLCKNFEGSKRDFSIYSSVSYKQIFVSSILYTQFAKYKTLPLVWNKIFLRTVSYLQTFCKHILK